MIRLSKKLLEFVFSFSEGEKEERKRKEEKFIYRDEERRTINKRIIQANRRWKLSWYCSGVEMWKKGRGVRVDTVEFRAPYVFYFYCTFSRSFGK